MLRVLAVSRFPSVRAGLRAMLAGLDGIGEVFESALEGLPEALASADVAVIDADPGDDLPADLDTLPAVFLGEPPTGGPAARGAGAAWLRRDATAEEIASAIVAVSRGLFVFDPSLLPSRVAEAVPAFVPEATAAAEALTEREREVLELMARGLPNKTIAHDLGISEHTVKFHVSTILGKLGAAGRTEAVTLAVRRGLLAL
jgi:DNA-binding CsgD family transcriptional regulator